MRRSPKRVVRSLFVAALVIPTVAACAAVGGGGNVETDCDSDVSGSELTPVATGSYDTEGFSCNNNEFVGTDLDAYAYPPSPDETGIIILCDEEDGTGATWTVYELVNGTPTEVASGDCDQNIAPFVENDEGDRFVLVIEHPASSGAVSFNLAPSSA